MFRDKYRTYINWGITVIAIIFVGIAFYFLFLRWSGTVSSFKTLNGILAPVSYGLIIAFILDSLVMTIVRLLSALSRGGKPLSRTRRRVYRIVGIIVSEIVFIAVITVLIQSIVPQVADSLRTLVSNFDRYIENLERWADKRVKDYPLLQPYLDSVKEQFSAVEGTIEGFLKNDLLSTLTRVTSVVTSGLLEVGTYVYNFLIGLVVSIYLLFSKERILGLTKKLLFSLAKPAHANRLLREARFTVQMFKGFLVGKLLDSIIVGVLCFLGTMILKIPYSLLISIIVGVTNIIPYFGPIIGAIPSAFLVLLLDPVKCLVFVIFIIVLQQLDGNVIGPKVLGNTTGVSSLGVMLSILIGGGMFGVPGMILCVPAYAVIYSLLKRAAERRLRKKGLPTDTEVYVSLDTIDPDTLIPCAPEPAPEPPQPAPPPAPREKRKKDKKKTR